MVITNIKYLPESPPNVDAHSIQPEESYQVAKVHTYC